MKAAVVRAFGKPLVIEELEIPQPGAGQVLLKMAASSVSHSDVRAISGDWPVKFNPPFVPGNNGVGFVAAVGAGVETIREGDRVGMRRLRPADGHCKRSMNGETARCEPMNGGLAEYVVADAQLLGHLPDNVGFVQSMPVFCAGVSFFKGLKIISVKPGDWVAISQIGGLGHMAVQYAVAMGLHVVAVDEDESRLALAKCLGAQLAVNSRRQDAAQFIKRRIGGVHGALVVDANKRSFHQALGMVRAGGTIALKGMPGGDFGGASFAAGVDGVQVRCSITVNQTDLREALEFSGAGKVSAMIKAEKFENINEAFERIGTGDKKGRVLFNFIQTANVSVMA